MNNFSKSICLFTLFSTIVSLNYSNTAHADIQGIPYNADFPKAEYPYAQAPDGCSGIKSTKEVRDTWGPVDFNGACNTHDKCYYTVGSKSNTCNERFYSDLRAACERDLRTAVRNPITRKKNYLPPDPIRLTTCYTIATSYYTGVQAGVGLGVFNTAQELQKRYEEWATSHRSAQVKNGAEDSIQHNRFRPGFYSRVGMNPPGIIYLWPSPWNAGKDDVWCNVPNHDMYVRNLNGIGSAIEVNSLKTVEDSAKYWSQPCSDDVFKQSRDQH